MSSQCAICFESITNDQHQLQCNHMFHNRCIEPWLPNNSCPLCRAVIRRVDDDELPTRYVIVLSLQRLFNLYDLQMERMHYVIPCALCGITGEHDCWYSRQMCYYCGQRVVNGYFCSLECSDSYNMLP